MSLFSSPKTTLVSPDQALPGRAQRPFPIPARHPVLGHPLEAPDGWPHGLAVLSLAMGCFWGAERRLWQLPGVYTTAVGYQGGATPNPTYDEVCTGRTGHTESVLVVYDPATLPEYDLFKTFWEHHDPTQGFRQGNDIGTQYRSAVYWTTPSQQDAAEATAAAYGAVLREHGLDPITTELAPAAGRPFYYAEPAHQQYLWTNPFGYDCHANTGLELPPPS